MLPLPDRAFHLDFESTTLAYYVDNFLWVVFYVLLLIINKNTACWVHGMFKGSIDHTLLELNTGQVSIKTFRTFHTVKMNAKEIGLNSHTHFRFAAFHDIFQCQLPIGGRNSQTGPWLEKRDSSEFVTDWREKTITKCVCNICPVVSTFCNLSSTKL